MKNLMIDLESLSTNLYGVVTQIGACYFDNQGKIGDKFLVNIDIASSLCIGLKIDGKTLKWWFERVNLITWLNNTVNITKALAMFRDFCYKNKKARVWSHYFDIYMIEGLYTKIGQKLPFSYRNWRDIRTLVDLSGLKTKKEKGDPKTHNALDDCIYQVKYVSKALRMIEGGYNEKEI